MSKRFCKCPNEECFDRAVGIRECDVPWASFRSTLVEPAAANAINCGPLTPMRVGAVSFIAPLWLSLTAQRPLGSSVLFLVLCTTLATHRPRDAWRQGLREDVDLLAILLWFLYNAFLTVRIIVYFATEGFMVQELVLLLGAIIFAGGTAFFDWLRCKYVYRSAKRDLCHVLMHTSGAVGTTMLLIVSNAQGAAPLMREGEVWVSLC